MQSKSEFNKDLDVGIGCSFAQDLQTGKVHINEISHGSPAHMCAALAVGDIVESIANQPVRGPHDAMAKARGEKGTLVSISIRRNYDAAEETIILLRDRPAGKVRTEDLAVGIGLGLNVVWEGLHVDSVIAGSPSWLSGNIISGDIITHIDGVDVRGGSRRPQAISEIIRGAPGTRATITLMRKGSILTAGVVRGHALDQELVAAYRRAVAARRAARTLNSSFMSASSIAVQGTPPMSPHSNAVALKEPFARINTANRGAMLANIPRSNNSDLLQGRQTGLSKSKRDLLLELADQVSRSIAEHEYRVSSSLEALHRRVEALSWDVMTASVDVAPV